MSEPIDPSAASSTESFLDEYLDSTPAMDRMTRIEGVASCFNLVATKARPLRERLGLALARVGIQRNTRAFQACECCSKIRRPRCAQQQRVRSQPEFNVWSMRLLSETCARCG